MQSGFIALLQPLEGIRLGVVREHFAEGLRSEQPGTPESGEREVTDEVLLVHEFLTRSAERFPSAEAVVDTRRRATYREILAEAAGVASWLGTVGIAPGDRVGMLLDDPCSYVAGYFGILMAGGVQYLENDSGRIYEGPGVDRTVLQPWL